MKEQKSENVLTWHVPIAVNVVKVLVRAHKFLLLICPIRYSCWGKQFAAAGVRLSSLRHYNRCASMVDQFDKYMN